jgi:hypothetical protein
MSDIFTHISTRVPAGALLPHRSLWQLAYHDYGGVALDLDERPRRGVGKTRVALLADEA